MQQQQQQQQQQRLFVSLSFFFYSINRMGIPFSRLGFLFCFITGQQEPLGIPIETKLFLLFPFFFVCVKI
jgi:hypothetical protein